MCLGVMVSVGIGDNSFTQFVELNGESSCPLLGEACCLVIECKTMFLGLDNTFFLNIRKRLACITYRPT